MGTQAWGPPMWTTIHFIALGYPANPTLDEKSHYQTFYENLYLFIPCKMCSDHYKAHIENLPVEKYLDSRDELFSWTVKLHNKVNVDLDKKEWSLEEAHIYYQNLLMSAQKTAFSQDSANSANSTNSANSANSANSVNRAKDVFSGVIFGTCLAFIVYILLKKTRRIK